MSIVNPFFSFEGTRGMLPAQVLSAALALPAWFALDHDAASPATMEAGVRDADAFVLLATDGCFTYNVRHEVACAVAMKKPLIVLRDAGGPPLDAMLEQACALLDAAGATARGLHHFDVADAAEFKARALDSSVIEFHRDARIVTETVPALIRALGISEAAAVLPRPYIMCAPRPLPDCSDALIVAAGSAALQALYIAELTRNACTQRALVISLLSQGSSADVVAEAVGRTNTVILVLSRDVWADAACVDAANAALIEGKMIVLVHEADALFGGEPIFSDIVDSTPDNLKGVHWRKAIPIIRGAGEEARFLERLLPQVGCEVAGPSTPALCDIQARIEAFPGSFRFLYGPSTTLDSPYNFVGLNPGGSYDDESLMSLETGNAFLDENWAGSGINPLQMQVQAFFRTMAERLAVDDWASFLTQRWFVSNYVFYRSSCWEEMAHKEMHIVNCKSIWSSQFARVPPKIIVCNGFVTYEAMKGLLVEQGWAVETECLSKSAWDGPHTGTMVREERRCLMVGFAHLSRFSVVDRPGNATAMEAVYARIKEFYVQDVLPTALGDAAPSATTLSWASLSPDAATMPLPGGMGVVSPARHSRGIY
jgi:hypothetical protein